MEIPMNIKIIKQVNDYPSIDKRVNEVRNLATPGSSVKK